MSKNNLAAATQMLAKIRAEGKSEGFAEGYRAAIRKMRGTLTDMAEDIAHAASDPRAADILAPIKEARRPRANSDQSKVYGIIAENPGLRGVEIAAKLATLEKPVNERTMRTALNRLKKKTQIENREGAWFPMQQH
jgi:hypothetical protein